MTREAFTLKNPGPDRKFGTSDDRTLAIKSVAYNPVTMILTITPKTVLGFNQFFQITMADNLTDLAGNRLDGDRDGTPGGSFVFSFAHGTNLAYTDRQGDQVTLKLTGAGALDMVRDATGEAIYLAITKATKTSIVTGAVKKSPAGDGTTGIATLVVAGRFTNKLGTKVRIGLQVSVANLDTYFTMAEQYLPPGG